MSVLDFGDITVVTKDGARMLLGTDLKFSKLFKARLAAIAEDDSLADMDVVSIEIGRKVYATHEDFLSDKNVPNASEDSK